MAPPLLEPEWRRVVVALARVAGWRVGVSSSAHSDPGIPDLTLIHPRGRVIFAELKRDTGQATAQQREVLDALRRAGVEAYLWRPRDRAKVERVLDANGSDRALLGPATTRDRLELIIEEAARAADLDVDDLTGRSRADTVTRARQVAMLLARDLVGATLTSIGDALNRDHTTVIHGIRTSRVRETEDPTYAHDVQRLRGRIVNKFSGPRAAETRRTSQLRTSSTGPIATSLERELQGSPSIVDRARRPTT